MTVAEHEVYKIVSDRHFKGKTTTSGDVAEAWGGKNRSYVYRVLKSLIDKDFVKKYSHIYYGLK